MAPSAFASASFGGTNHGRRKKSQEPERETVKNHTLSRPAVGSRLPEAA